MHVKITNTDLVREMASQAILSTNSTELNQYQRLRKSKLQEKRDKYSLEQRVLRLEKIIEELLK
jgi:hypothetical protein